MTHETEHSKHICFKTEEGENRPQSYFSAGNPLDGKAHLCYFFQQIHS